MEALTTVDADLMRQKAGDMLVETVATRLARFVRPTQLRRELEEIISELRGKPTRLNQDSFDELLGKDHNLNAQESSERPEKTVQKQIALLKDIISDDSLDAKVILTANAQLTEMIGTSAKYRSEVYEPQDIAAMTRRMVEEMGTLVEEEDAMYS